MIGNKVISLSHINSTNKYANELLESGNPDEGTVIIAEYQDSGRGQRESIWESEAGKNILCSIILYPTFLPVANQFMLNQVVSLAVSDVVESLSGFVPQIKWPNDILVNENKIAGILTENSIRGNIISSSIIGVGLNVNQLVFRNFGYAAVSLASLAGKNYDKNTCSSLLFEKLDHFYKLLKNNEWHFINELYMERLFRLNETAMFEINGKPAKAIIRGVRPEGELVMEMADGIVRYIRTREVKYLF